MKKILLLITVLFAAISSFAQKPDLIRSPNGPNTIVDWNVKFKTMILPHGTTYTLAGAQDTTGHIRLKITGIDTTLGVYVRGKGWIDVGWKKDISKSNVHADSLFALAPKLAGNNIFTGTTNIFNSTLQLNGNFNMTGNADITGQLNATTLFSGNSTTNNLHVGTGIGGAWIDFISTGSFPYPYNWRIGDNVGGLDDYFYIKYRNNEIAKLDTFGTVFIDNLKDNSGKFYLKTGDAIDSTTISNTYAKKDSVILNVENGLTNIAGIGKLGGDLTGNTNINSGDYSFGVTGNGLGGNSVSLFKIQTTDHGNPSPRINMSVTNYVDGKSAFINLNGGQVNLQAINGTKAGTIIMDADSIHVNGRMMYDSIPVYTNPLQFAAIGDIVDIVSIANIYVPKTGNTTISGNKTFTGETVFNTSTTLTDGTKNFKTQFGTVAGISGQPFFQADSGYYVFKPLGTHAPRFYLLPTGTITGTTSKFEMFNTDYIADQVNYSAFNIILNNVTNTINIGANRNGSATRLQTIIGGDYNGSVLQAASPKITFNTDNSLSLSGNNMTNEAVVRNNFRINGNDVGGWNQFGLGIGLSSTSFANPFDIVISTTGGTIGRIKNPTAGTGNYSRFIWESDIINQFLVTAQSSTFTSNGINRQSGVVLNSTGVGALNIGATNASGTIGIYTGGSLAANERINIDASGNTTLKVSTKTPLLTLTNLSTGTGGTDSLLVKNATTNIISKIAANYYAPISNPTFTNGLTLNTSSTGTVQSVTVNSNAGSAADARMSVSNGTSLLSIIMRGTGFTSNANNGVFSLTGTGSMAWSLNGVERARILTNGNWGIGTSSPAGGIHVARETAGIGTISTTAVGTTVTGISTDFLNRFKIGQTITANGETRTISAIASDVSMTTDAWTNTNSSIAFTTTSLNVFIARRNGEVFLSQLTTNGGLLYTSGTTGLIAQSAAITGIIKGNGTLSPSLAVAGTDFSLPTGIETLTNKTLTTPKLTGFLVSGLPAGTIGMSAYVTDALSPVVGSPVVGGGTSPAQLWHNGTTWTVTGI